MDVDELRGIAQAFVLAIQENTAQLERLNAHLARLGVRTEPAPGPGSAVAPKRPTTKTAQKIDAAAGIAKLLGELLEEDGA